MTAMGNHLADPGGFVSDRDIAFYAERAKGGCGLIITECTAVDWAHGKGNMAEMSIDNNGVLEGYRKMAEEVHRFGALFAVQIYHPGRQGIAAINDVDSMPSASAIPCKLVQQPVHEMTTDEIREMQDKFVEAAVRVQKSGADFVELHAAHGYLINQFLSPYTNHRMDEYGGNLDNRLRFIREIMEGIQERCGEYPILVRISADEHLDYNGQEGEGILLSEGVEIARRLESYGAAAIDVSAGIYETMNVSWEPVGFHQGWKLDGPAAVKKAVGIPVIGTAVLRDPDFVDQAIADGKIDFMGSARTFLADPFWAKKAQEGRLKEIRKCIQCLYCMESLGKADIDPNVTMSCAVNYEAGRETEVSSVSLPKTGENRTVVIIGAGPAGLEAARILAIRGFQPVILEKNGYVGGKTCLASKPPEKEKTMNLIRYQIHELARYGVPVMLNTPADAARIRALKPYAVIAANGTHPIMPASIPGIDGANVYHPEMILEEEVVLRNCKVVVVGSGMTGLETAEFAAARGNTVSVYEMDEKIGRDVFPQILSDCLRRMEKYGVRFETNCKLVSLKGNMARFEIIGEESYVQVKADAFIIALGNRPAMEYHEEWSEGYTLFKVIGDASESGRIEAAVRTGYEAGYYLMS